MTSKRSMKALLKKARTERRSEPFSVAVGSETVEGTFTVIPFLKWQGLIVDHPPRPAAEVDEGWGFSVAGMWPAVIRTAWVDAGMDDADWSDFFEVVHPADVVRLGLKVYMMQATPPGAESVDLPKSSSESPETTSLSSD